MDEREITRAAELLRRGELIAFPTDTVYGVGAIVWDVSAVNKLYAAKLRSLDKAIPVLLADAADLHLVTERVPPAARRLMARFWPGPLTLVVGRAPGVPLEVTAGGDSLAVRVPDHAVARALIRAAGAPLATTSANLSGLPSPVTAQEVLACEPLAAHLAMVLDGGPCPGGTPSAIVDLTGPEPALLRAGPIAWSQILEALDADRD